MARFDDIRRGGVATADGARLHRREAAERRRGWRRGSRLGGARLGREVRAARATERRTGAGLAAPSGRTLEDVLASAWEDLMAGARTGCPVCSGAMTPGGGTPEDRSGIGSCGDCGSELA